MKKIESITSLSGTTRRITGYLFATQNSIISAAFIIGFTYGISAILGLVRSRLLASYFGASDLLAVFYTADKIPSFIYTILVVGTLSTIFIPVFTGLLREDEDEAWQTASSMLTVSVLFFIIIGLLVFIFSVPLTRLLSLDKFTESQVALGAQLMRYMLLAQIILVVSSFFTSILQSFKMFLIPAFAPVVYNVGMIMGIIYLSPKYGILGAAYGVIIGALFHLLLQIPMLSKVNIRYKVSIDLKNYGIRQIFKLMPPRILGAAITQFIGIVNNSLAILVSTSSVVVFKFAGQLQSFPVIMFGSSIAQASLPTLSYESSLEDRTKFKDTFLTTFHQTMFLVMPASIVLLILKLPAVRLVYGAASFPWEATVRTSYTLGFFSLSIFAQSGVFLLNRAFYAIKDTITPVIISICTIAFSILISILFVTQLKFGVWAVALSFTLATFLDLIFLFWMLNKKLGGFDLERLFLPFIKISYATLFMGVSLYFPLKLLDYRVIVTDEIPELLLVTIISGVFGVASYLLFTRVFRVAEVELLYKLLTKIKRNLNFKVEAELAPPISANMDSIDSDYTSI